MKMAIQETRNNKVEVPGVRHSRARPIVLMGFMGAGKTALAERLGQFLDEDVIDTDDILEEQFGQTIDEFFNEHGEQAFREREERLVLELLNRDAVLALGGGAVESENVRRALANHMCV